MLLAVAGYRWPLPADLPSHSIVLCVVCSIATRKILGFYISVVNSSRLNVLKEGWDSVSPQSHALNPA
jgi:hypothetical protein